MEPESQTFDDKIENIKKVFLHVLDDFKKYYVFYNKNPEVNEYQNYYVNNKSQLQKLSGELFLTTNDIHKNIENLNLEMQEISGNLEDEKKVNTNLLKIIKKLETSYNGSEILIEDSKSLYNYQYYKNLEMMLGIVILGKYVFSL
jgi:galactitol-specific phosphotransferase system IIB component